MKAIPESRLLHNKGFSLIELVIVITIILSLAAVVGIYGKQWMDMYKAESQIRQMHTDLLQARAQAMERNMQSAVRVNSGSYQIGLTDDNGNTTWQPAKTLAYVVSSGTGTITMDQRGIISPDTLTIQFNTGSGTPEYDCMQLYATRINIGKMNGANCVTR
jgi:prepilin-type N-terminal cleavage/methylation domain-containing protein